MAVWVFTELRRDELWVLTGGPKLGPFVGCAWRAVPALVSALEWALDTNVRGLTRVSTQPP